ncbi:protein kintoun [Sphaeramia orbicularis]|uniref:protein kintoun n=1 Tax=Sphaeramia orbicularis TaxID=375764 RepID=UPI00117CA2DC|nr:protein kintoun [Sphaeramia orbicularis]
MELGEKLKELNMTEEEIGRFSKAFKDEKFREMLCEYAEEISNPENKKRYEEEIRLLEQERGHKVEFIHPEPFRCLRTSVNGKEKCYINICSNEKVGKPSCKSGVSETGQRGHCWSLPHCLHPGRQDIDQKGKKIMIYDVIFHPDTIHMASKSKKFMEIVDGAAIQGIQEGFKVTLDKNNVKHLKVKYKGTPQAPVIRKPIPGYQAKEVKDGQPDPLAVPYPDEKRPTSCKSTTKGISATKPQSFQIQPEKTNKPTEPKYTVKYRSFIDLQDFRCSRDSGRSPRPKEIVVTIDLPLLKSVADTSLEIKEQNLLLESKNPAYRLELTLAYLVDEDKGEAKFNKHSRQLIVTLPVLPSKEVFDFPGAPPAETVTEIQRGDEDGQEEEEGRCEKQIGEGEEKVEGEEEGMRQQQRVEGEEGEEKGQGERRDDGEEEDEEEKRGGERCEEEKKEVGDEEQGKGRESVEEEKEEGEEKGQGERRDGGEEEDEEERRGSERCEEQKKEVGGEEQGKGRESVEEKKEEGEQQKMEVEEGEEKGQGERRDEGEEEDEEEKRGEKCEEEKKEMGDEEQGKGRESVEEEKEEGEQEEIKQQKMEVEEGEDEEGTVEEERKEDKKCEEKEEVEDKEEEEKEGMKQQKMEVEEGEDGKDRGGEERGQDEEEKREDKKCKEKKELKMEEEMKQQEMEVEEGEDGKDRGGEERGQDEEEEGEEKREGEECEEKKEVGGKWKEPRKEEEEREEQQQEKGQECVEEEEEEEEEEELLVDRLKNTREEEDVNVESTTQMKTSDVQEETEKTDTEKMGTDASFLHQIPSANLPLSHQTHAGGSGRSSLSPEEAVVDEDRSVRREGIDEDDLTTEQVFPNLIHEDKPPPMLLREVSEDGSEKVISDHSTSAGFTFQNSLLFELD